MKDALLNDIVSLVSYFCSRCCNKSFIVLYPYILFSVVAQLPKKFSLALCILPCICHWLWFFLSFSHVYCLRILSQKETLMTHCYSHFQSHNLLNSTPAFFIKQCYPVIIYFEISPPNASPILIAALKIFSFLRKNLVPTEFDHPTFYQILFPLQQSIASIFVPFGPLFLMLPSGGSIRFHSLSGLV